MIFKYKDMNGNAAVCDIERHGNLIIATELAENTGGSVTNSSEYIATQFCESNGVPLEDVIVVERYDHRSYNTKNPIRLSKVTYQIGSRMGKPHLMSPDWSYIMEDQLEDIIEQQ